MSGVTDPERVRARNGPGMLEGHMRTFGNVGTMYPDMDITEIYDIDCILLQEILESPLRAGNYVLDEMKNEQIFHGAWDCITDEIIHGYDGKPWVSDAISPMGFKNLHKILSTASPPYGIQDIKSISLNMNVMLLKIIYHH
ncbi:hypothetical protein BDQ17DRAFT_1433520 [Cyathus striatus]|nr:hypothetical protein BDQ17DRAFT_1433520 [Cyathus striatus]